MEFHLSALWVKICCGYGTGTVKEPKGRGMSTFGSQYQGNDEETADLEDSVHV
jgi:hypothetical protein